MFKRKSIVAGQRKSGGRAERERLGRDLFHSSRQLLSSFKYSFWLLIASLFLCIAVARADELHLKDGRVIEAEETWQVGESVWYRQGKIIASVLKTDVVRIAKPKPAPAPDAAPATAPATTSERGGKVALPKEPRPDDAQTGEVITRKVARILLKDGTQIDADAVWEDTDRVGYRLGKMHAFVERAEVKTVFRDLSVSEEKAPSGMKLHFTTGHRGLDQLILYSSGKYQIDPLLIYLIMREESGFNHRAVSRVGARGLMQLMPGTAQRLGVRNIHDPVENVDAGTKYLRSLLEMFNGDVNLALAAYNAGENAVMRYGRRIPPYRETMNYVWRINSAYRRAVAGTQ
jgi:hypothetical protein